MHKIHNFDYAAECPDNHDLAYTTDNAVYVTCVWCAERDTKVKEEEARVNSFARVERARQRFIQHGDGADAVQYAGELLRDAVEHGRVTNLDHNLLRSLLELAKARYLIESE